MSEPYQFENDLSRKSVKLSSGEPVYKGHSLEPDAGMRGPHFQVNDPIVEKPDERASQKIADEEEGLLIQASQIADHLRSQFDEINRRENNLNEQLSLLDKERRTMRMWVSQIELELTERDDLLKQREKDLNEKLTSCNVLIQKIESGDIAGAGRVAEERVTESKSIDVPDLDRFMNLEKENQRLKFQLHQLDESHIAEIEELRDELERDQEALVAEYEQLKQKHLAEKQEWVDEHGDLDVERQLYTKAIERSQTELDEILGSQTSQLNEQQELLRSASEEFALEREKLSGQLEETIRERDTLNLKLAENEEVLKVALEEQSHQPVDQVTLNEFEETQQQFQQQEAVFENRKRFQEAHLEKAREELQLMQNNLKQEKQKASQYFEEKNSILQMQKTQLNRFRESIDSREESLKRSEVTLKDEYRTLKSDVVLEKQQLEKMKTRLNQQREMELKEISNLRETLNVKNDLLEKQKKRLDVLKKEVDQTGREQLETKCVLERIQAEFLESPNSQNYSDRFSSAQVELQMSFQDAKEELDQQQIELQQLKEGIDDQSQLFDQERTQFKQWVERQKENLSEWENSLVSQSAQSKNDESHFKVRSQKWTEEKLEAESIIRGLLSQIEENEVRDWDEGTAVSDPDSQGPENQAA
jgi:hypothetical protein